MTRNVTVAGAVSPPEAWQDATTGAAGGTPTDTPERRKGRDQGPTIEQLASAVARCYDGEATDQQIARSLHVARRTLARWKHHELWQPMHLALCAYGRIQTSRQIDAWVERRVEEMAARAAEHGGVRRRRRRR
jgi:hypothetical protein